jgi:apolipoprotein N-acyltransferase
MFGFLFIYWIWKAFGNLALEYAKNKWKYFFIGLGSYYGITFLSAIIYVLVIAIFNGFDVLDDNSYYSSGIDFIFALAGGLGCYGVYKYLESKGQQERELAEKEGIESIGVVQEN